MSFWECVAGAFDAPTWEQAVAAVDSPRKAARLARLYVEFRDDDGDEWADGKTTWQRGFGDCEDLAAVVVQLCEEAGLETDADIQVFATPIDGGHAVAMGRWRGRMWVSSNGWFQYAESVEHAVLQIAEEMQWHKAAISVTPLDRIRRAADAGDRQTVAGRGR
jgi:hypothetical protein